MDHDEPPYADPQIQKDYEAALGDFLVRFNRIENLIADIAYRALKRYGRTDLAASTIKQPLQQRLDSLELILLGVSNLRPLPYAAIKALAKDRNTLAHGHFNQNPFQGDYVIVGRGGEGHDWDPASIAKLAVRADELWDDLRGIEAWFLFDEVDREQS